MQIVPSAVSGNHTQQDADMHNVYSKYLTEDSESPELFEIAQRNEHYSKPSKAEAAGMAALSGCL